MEIDAGVQVSFQANATNTVAAALEHARSLLIRHPGAAAQQAREVIRVEPGIAEAYIVLSCALRALGDREADAAEDEGLRVANADPTIRKASEHIRAGRLKEADALLNLYLADTPNDPVAVYHRALVQEGLGDADGACALLKRATTISPNYQDAREALIRLVAELAPTESEPTDWFTEQAAITRPTEEPK